MSKVAVITGVSRGLGLAVARRLLAHDWRVFGLSRSDSAEWRALAAGHGDRARWTACDLGDAAAVEKALAQLRLGEPIAALVNNAAIAYDDLVTNLHRAELERSFAINVFTPMLLTRHVIRNMLLHGTAGAIVHVSSISVRSGSRGLAMYAATKGALEAFSRSTAREWGARGIRSNCVVPGFMDTEMTATMSAERKEKIHRRTALGTATAVESVAATVQFLLSEGASSITGQDLVVDAGLI